MVTEEDVTQRQSYCLGVFILIERHRLVLGDSFLVASNKRGGWEYSRMSPMKHSPFQSSDLFLRGPGGVISSLTCKLLSEVWDGGKTILYLKDLFLWRSLTDLFLGLWMVLWTIWSCLFEVFSDKQIFICFSIGNLFDGHRVWWPKAGSSVFLFKKVNTKV